MGALIQVEGKKGIEPCGIPFSVEVSSNSIRRTRTLFGPLALTIVRGRVGAARAD